jgi:lipopolysaccharide transport system permease protein
MQFWFWLTPIVYPIAVVPAFVRDWFAFNPMTPIVVALQRIFVEGTAPQWESLALPIVAAAVALFAGAMTFRANADDIADEL